MTELLYASDNAVGVSPAIMAAIAACDAGEAPAYGDDAFSARVNDAFSEAFEHEAFVFSAPTGTAANALALSAVTPPYGETLCHEEAHILTTEGGAPEFYAGGSRLVAIGGDACKITADGLEGVLRPRSGRSRHRMLPASLSLTQATEAGTVYSLDELAALAQVAHGHGLKVQMDGARFANALVALGASPAAMSWRAGVDILSLGTTKNGTMNAEAVIAFDRETARDLAFRYKRAGLLTSKMRYVSAQLLAFLKDGLWLAHARNANATARALADILGATPGIRIVHPVQTNQIFAEIQPEVTARLEAAGLRFRVWDPHDPLVFRLVTSFKGDDGTPARIAAALAAR